MSPNTPGSTIRHAAATLNTAGRAQKHILDLVDKALAEAAITPGEIDVIAYTKVGHCSPSASACRH